MSTITKKRCPQCGSGEVEMIGSGAFMCRACGHSGSVHQEPLVGGEAKISKKGGKKK